MHRKQTGNTGASLVFMPHEMAWSFWRDHKNVRILGGLMKPKWIEKPCEKASVFPGVIDSAISCVYTSGASSSGTSIITMSASAAAWATGKTRRPAASALAFDGLSERKPTVTLQPDSRKLFDCAKPWLP